MTKEDVLTVIGIIAIALAIRDYCDGVTKPYEELQEEMVEILKYHFGIVLKIDKDNPSYSN